MSAASGFSGADFEAVAVERQRQAILTAVAVVLARLVA